jgi:thiol-disulfide isomerase/thioredoxin
MKKLILLLILTSVIKIQAQLNNYSNGDTVNDFTVTDVNGNTHNLYTYTASGKYVYIDFFYSICGGCQNFIPTFNELYDKYGCNEGDLVCLAINSGYDKDNEVINFENTYGGTFNHAPAVSSEGGCHAVIADFDPMYYPAVCLIAPDNTMVNSNISPYDTLTDLEAAFPTGFNPAPLTCTIGIDDVITPNDFSIYPNPATPKGFSINLGNNQNAQVQIYTILGEKVFSKNITKVIEKIQPKLTSGAYFLSVKTKKGILTKKLIIK